MKKFFVFILKVYLSFYYPLSHFLVKRVLTVLLGMIILGALVFLVLDRYSPIPYSIFVVASNSMAPTMVKGDMIVVQKRESYEVNDIITFYPYNDLEERDLVTHRIVDVSEEDNQVAYSTKGDDNPDTDTDKIYDFSILGKVVKIFGGWGRLILFIRSVLGIILLLIIPGTVILTLHLADWSKKVREFYEEHGMYRVVKKRPKGV